MQYFTDRERGPPERRHTAIPPVVWAGLVAHIESLVLTGAFAERYPEVCPDGAGPVATNQKLFAGALQAEVPGLLWPLQFNALSADGFTHEEWAPDTCLILDLIEFCHSRVSKPARASYHQFFKHYHLSFDEAAGRAELRGVVNTLFERNGIAFEIEERGLVRRLVPSPFEERLTGAEFRTGDTTLDNLLAEARSKHLRPRAALRKEAVERLWDAWERLKSLKDPTNKKLSTEVILDQAAKEPAFRQLLEVEARELTDIGNRFQIRHTEVDKTAIADDGHLDYLFQRLYAMIWLVLRKL